jgi:histidinol-phosphate aminotransferase
MIVLCTPNNPTGGAVAREEIERIHDETDALIVLDQAYVEFGGYDAIPLLNERPRLVVLRTFSKAMSMAGLRAGYLLGIPARARGRQGEAAVQPELRHRDGRGRGARETATCSSRRWPAIRASVTGCIAAAAIPGSRPSRARPTSSSSASSARTSTTGTRVRAAARGARVLVRDVSGYPMLERCLRVNAGTPDENDVPHRNAAILGESLSPHRPALMESDASGASLLSGKTNREADSR